MNLQSSNPLLANDDAFDQHYGLGREAGTAAVAPDTASLAGIVNKTGILAAIAVVGGMIGYSLVTAVPGLLWISAITGFIVTLGMMFVIRGNPKLAKVLGPVYAIVEGVFLGALTSLLDTIVAERTGMTMSLALPAFVITISCLLSMLGLYKAGIIRPTERFKAVLGVVTGGIMIAYLLMFVLSFFGIQVPFLSLGSAMQGGNAALIGIGLNLAILVIAALWLVIDFEQCEHIVAARAPRDMEWLGAVGLIVTLAWIYYEAVKLSFRVAMLLGNRD